MTKAEMARADKVRRGRKAMGEKKTRANLDSVKQSNLNSVKQVISVVIDNFIKEEVGNRVTRNNMAGLTMTIMQAMDGNITLEQPPAPPGEEEKPV
jgi:hypothetical protein